MLVPVHPAVMNELQASRAHAQRGVDSFVVKQMLQIFGEDIFLSLHVRGRICERYGVQQKSTVCRVQTGMALLLAYICIFECIHMSVHGSGCVLHE
jgi:hypothetical protein